MNRKAVRTIGMIMVIILLSKVLGLARDMFLTAYYGSGAVLDAFTTAADIPLKFFDLAFGAAVTSTFIPVFNSYIKNENQEEGFLFASRFINIVFLMISFVSVIGMVFSKQIVMILMPGGSGEVWSLAANLLRIMFPAAAFAGLAFSMISILQSMGQFMVPAMISLFPNVLMIGYILLFNDRYGITGLAVAFLLAWLMQVLVQIPFVRQKKFIYSPSVSIRDKGIRKVSKMVLPILVGSWVTPVSLFILAAFASYMGEGAVTSIRLSNRLYLILAGIFVFAMMNYLFPLMSRQSEDTDKGEFMNTYRKAFESLCFFILPLSAAAFILSPNIISVLYERGQFTSQASQMMAVAFSGFTPAIFGYSLYEITTKAYYAGKKVLVPTLVSVATLASTLILSSVVVLATGLGIGFVSLSFSVSILIASIVMAVLFGKSHKGAFDKRSISELARGIAGTLVMTLVLYIFREFIFVSTGIGSTLLTAVAGGTVYILSMAAMKSPTFAYYYEWFLEKVVKNR